MHRKSNPFSVIPSPHGPKALDSFFIPFTEECMAIACGIWTYNVLMTESFDLHTYLITFSGDLPAISKFLYLWGHGTYCPCCCCLIRGERILGTRNSKYYQFWYLNSMVYSTRSCMTPGTFHHEQGRIWRPNSLRSVRQPLSVHVVTLGWNITSITYLCPCTFHPCIFLSHFHMTQCIYFSKICLALFDQWSQSHKFKLVAPVDPRFQIAPHIWDQIGCETTKAFKTIPSAFIGAIPNITTSKYKIKYQLFWIQYLGPIYSTIASPMQNITNITVT